MKTGVDMVCEAHSMMNADLERVKNDIGDLYTQDRETQKVMADIQRDIAEIKTDNKNMKEDIIQFRTDISELKTELSDVKEKVSNVDGKVESIESNISTINQTIKQINKNTSKQWSPKDYVTVIVALLALVGTVVTAIYN